MSIMSGFMFLSRYCVACLSVSGVDPKICWDIGLCLLFVCIISRLLVFSYMSDLSDIISLDISPQPMSFIMSLNVLSHMSAMGASTILFGMVVFFIFHFIVCSRLFWVIWGWCYFIFLRFILFFIFGFHVLYSFLVSLDKVVILLLTYLIIS